MKKKNVFFLLFALAMVGTAAQAQQPVVCFRSTDGHYWQMSVARTSGAIPGTAQVTVRSDQPRQTFRGWGTCFNELPWDAYNLLDSTQQRLFVRRLFNPLGDLRLTVGRIPVGASDYARDWYSCDETPGDFAMEHFNIDRDLQAVIPSIKAAQQQNPNMTFWASPWSPPQWMKTNKHYAQRKTATNGCPFDVPPYFNDQFIDSARYYNAYCLYFDKFIQAYAAQGIPITALAYQNEAYSNTPYPGCSWTAKTTGKFLGKYLGPYFAKHQPNVKLIVGTMNTGSLDVFEQILNSEGVQDYCKQIGFQWEGGRQIAEVMARHQQYEAVMTESECGSGTFDWGAAAHTFQLINHYLGNGVTTYTYWNAILKDNGVSHWGWVQNALVQVNSATHRPRYTAEYYAFKHYSHLIAPGSKILTVDEGRQVLAARTPEGAVVVVAGNNSDAARTLSLDVDGERFVAQLPAKSFSSYVFGSDAVRARLLADEAEGLITVEQGRLGTADKAVLQRAIQLQRQGSEQAFDSLAFAVGRVESDTTAERHNTLTNADFADGLIGWTTANQAKSGDFRPGTVAGRTCWNNWSNNFTSMDIYQDLTGLKAGVYRVSALSMCGPGEITDQHVYAVAQSDTAVSAAKRVAIWNTAAGWEQQTTQKVVVGTDGTLRVGYASTSGGGTKGWFCVTGFRVDSLGDDASAVDSVLQAAVARATASGSATLCALAAEAARAAGTAARLQALTALRAALAQANRHVDLTAYEAAVAVADSVAGSALYDSAARAGLRSLMSSQADRLTDIHEQVDIDDMTRALQQRTHEVMATRQPGSDDDMTYMIRNAGAESADGWALSLTNGDQTIKSGQHYSGDAANTYFDSYNATKGNLWYTGRQTLHGLPRGTYRLVAAARSDGDGAVVWAETSDRHYQGGIAADGNAATAGTLGQGWNTVTVDGIVVTDSTLTIGFSNDMYLTGLPRFTGTWFSVDDFRLIRLSDAVSTGLDAMQAPAGRTVYYTLAGQGLPRPEGRGVYVVNRHKVLVR